MAYDIIYDIRMQYEIIRRRLIWNFLKLSRPIRSELNLSPERVIHIIGNDFGVMIWKIFM